MYEIEKQNNVMSTLVYVIDIFLFMIDFLFVSPYHHRKKFKKVTMIVDGMSKTPCGLMSTGFYVYLFNERRKNIDVERVNESCIVLG